MSLENAFDGEEIDRLLDQAGSVPSSSGSEGYGLVVEPVAVHTTSPRSPEERVDQMPDELMPFTEIIDKGGYESLRDFNTQALVLQPQAEESYEEALEGEGSEEAFNDLIDLTDRALEQGIIFKDEIPEQVGQSFRYFNGQLLRADVASYDAFEDIRETAESYGEEQVERNVARAYMDAARGTAKLSGEDEGRLLQVTATESDYINEGDYAEREGTRYQDLLGALELPEF